MKRKDDLLRLAFGELNDDAARAVETRSDDADRAEIEAFRRLRDDLHQLPPPPPDNLTAERLRAAILDRELKSRRPLNWGALIMGPAVLASLAFAVLVPRLRPQPEPRIVARSEVNLMEAQASAQPKFDEFRPLHSSLASGDRVQPRAAVPPPVHLAERPQAIASGVETRRHRGHHHRVRSEEPDRLPFDNQDLVTYNPPIWDGTEPSSSAMVAVHEPQTIAAPTSDVVKAEPGATGKTETVVIVSTKRDLETGAPAATEQEASSVLVGG